jgi:hypothetical protein
VAAVVATPTAAVAPALAVATGATRGSAKPARSSRGTRRLLHDEGLSSGLGLGAGIVDDVVDVDLFKE